MESSRGQYGRLSIVSIVLLLGGCVSSSSSASTTTSSTGPAPVPTVSAGVGSLTGTVTDQELGGLAGAMVGVTQLPNAQATTDNAGRFTINNLAPGTYAVAAQKLGYESQGKKVAITDGQVTDVSFTLVAIAVDESHAETFQYDGFFSCGASSPVLTVACRDTVDAGDKTSFTTNVSAKLGTFVDAMTWDASAPLTAKTFRDIVTLDAPSTSAQNSTKSPLIVRIDPAPTKRTAHVNHLVWIAFSGTGDPTQVAVLVYQQKFHIVSTAFYGQPAPEGFTGLPT